MLGNSFEMQKTCRPLFSNTTFEFINLSIYSDMRIVVILFENC